MILNMRKGGSVMTLFIVFTSLLLLAGCETAYRSASDECDRAIEEDISTGRYNYNLN